MKNYLKFAAALAALASISPALAQTNRAGSWELTSRPAPGPSRSGLVQGGDKTSHWNAGVVLSGAA